MASFFLFGQNMDNSRCQSRLPSRMVPSLAGLRLISFDFVVSVVVSVGCSGVTFVTPCIRLAFIATVTGFIFVSKYFSTSAAT